jgi:hypothetical protein
MEEIQDDARSRQVLEVPTWFAYLDAVALDLTDPKALADQVGDVDT